jgi:hypothetical protein
LVKPVAKEGRDYKVPRVYLEDQESKDLKE